MSTFRTPHRRMNKIVIDIIVCLTVMAATYEYLNQYVSVTNQYVSVTERHTDIKNWEELEAQGTRNTSHVIKKTISKDSVLENKTENALLGTVLNRSATKPQNSTSSVVPEWKIAPLKDTLSVVDTEYNRKQSKPDNLSNSVVSEWRMAPHLLPLEVRRKLHDSGGDADHLKQVQSMQTHQPITILLWSVFWYLDESPSFQNCPVNNCILHQNKSRLEGSDAVLFYMPSFKKNDVFPERRFPGQKWIYLSLENPTYFEDNNLVKFLTQHQPDLTATYLHSSDIVLPYGIVVPRTHDPGSQDRHNFAEGKSKTELIVWPVSHCKTQSKRMAYVKRLQKYIAVSIYGKCGPYKCVDSAEVSCLREFNKTYKFYLSFENGVCDDYVTEKVFNVLEYDMIPIVLGGADYKQILPIKSYIDIKDYASPKHLSDYLYHLIQNDAEYNTYFAWKRYYQIDKRFWVYNQLCSLCHGLHRLRNASNVSGNASSVPDNAGSVLDNASNVSGNTNDVRPDFRQWWYGSCHSPAEYYKGHVIKWY